ncbi:hypothetical protein F5X98DRAFT_378091 [Xylaria grammica]|nr:hypothetical protein F5X98DRAFT_378091 [Xylaria grammica]
MPNRRAHGEKGIERILEDQRECDTHPVQTVKVILELIGSSRSYPNPPPNVPTPPPVADYEAVTEEIPSTTARFVSPAHENVREHHPTSKRHDYSASSNKHGHHSSSSKQRRNAKSKNHEHGALSNKHEHRTAPKKHKHRSSSRTHEHSTSSDRADFSSKAETLYREAKSGNFETGDLEDPEPEPKDTPSPLPRNTPLPIQQALAKGEKVVHSLGVTIDVVLLYEWCMDGDNFHTLPGDFKSRCKVIPVERDRVGKYQPIEDLESEWGVKTEYDPNYSTYIASILIRIPPELSGLSKAQLNAAYNRFFVGPRSERLAGVLAIPFKDHPECRKYAMLFHFESGSKKPRLFDDYILEDAVIEL